MTNGKVVSTFGEAGGAIGLVCGLLLICMYVFIRYLMERSKERDGEILDVNRQLQQALVSNAEMNAKSAAAISSLAQILQLKPCLYSEQENLEQLRKEAQCHPTKKE